MFIITTLNNDLKIEDVTVDFSFSVNNQTVNYSKVYKIGNLIVGQFRYFSSNNNLSVIKNSTMLTLPAKYAPAYPIQITCPLFTGESNPLNMGFAIAPNRIIYTYGTDDIANQRNITTSSFAYICVGE